ncbi:unnamed protein product [Brachionus calyciflorus]|uniref:Uncharacterized protein n=1 Tax=Brachionus calyciflorus TaxID=104777 RepID=A0A814C2F0_9BILA|nr:unnamed protein product [Brachionus calyciflorus]
MKIENQDALKKWLVKILNPIFEGDSDKLGLYIVALAKKVENDQASRQRCIDDLEVFLESNTHSFVENFFDALFNKTYLQSETNENETQKPKDESKEFDQKRLSDPGSRVQRSRLSRDYQEIDVSNRPNRASSHGRRRKNRSRTRTHGASRSSSSSSSSISPVRRSRSRSPYSRSRSRSPGQILEPKKQRCKDYDEKGFCTKGETCPYDHVEALVAPSSYIQSGQISGNSQYNPQYGKRRNQINKNGQHQRFQKHQGGNFNQRIGNVNNMPANLNENNMYTPSPLPQNQVPQRQVITTNRPRNLVSIVTSIHEDDTQDQSHQRGVKRTFNSQIKPGPSDTNNNSFNNNNNSVVYDVNNDNLLNQQQNIPQQNIQQQQALLPTPNFPQVRQPNIQNNQNTTLVLRKIPTSLNTVDKMQQHFSKFGNIVDIQCHFDNLNDAAMIKFSSNSEAFAAYKSPQPVFNNRFIRLYWLSSYLKQQQQQQPQQQQQHQQQQQNPPQSPALGEPIQKRPAKERLSFPKTETDISTEGLNKENLAKPTTSTVNVTSTGLLTKTVYASQSLSADITKTSEEIVKKIAVPETPESLAMAKQIQEENKKKALLLKTEVQKKARELIEQQLKDQKILMAKLEQAKTVEEKTQILNLVKKLSEAIDKEKEILNKKIDALDQEKLDLDSTKPASPKIQQSPFTFQKIPPSSTKPSFVIPPVHQLKINNKRLNTTSFLKAGANKLVNTKTASVSASTVMMSNVAAPNLFSFNRVSVDNRPKQLIVTGVENQQEKTNIVNFITSLGCQIENVNEEKSETNSNQMSLIINFVTRRDAEVALAKCTASLTSKKITINWYRPPVKTVELTESSNKEEKSDELKESNKNENENQDIVKSEDPNDSLTNFLSEEKIEDKSQEIGETSNGQITETTEDNVFDSLFNDKE